MTNKAVTLIELLIAISLLTLILLAGSGIYLSGWNLFRNAQLIAQAQRNAVIPMMHITKQLQTASSFRALGLLQFTITTSGTPVTGSYLFNTNNGTITYDPDITVTGNEIIISNNITAPTTFAIPRPVIANITITATDNNGGNPYTISSSIEARYGGTTQ